MVKGDVGEGRATWRKKQKHAIHRVSQLGLQKKEVPALLTPFSDHTLIEDVNISLDLRRLVVFYGCTGVGRAPKIPW